MARPPRLFSNRNSAVIYANIFVVSMLNYWVIFFLPLHFQAVQLSTPTRSGVQILPVTLIAVPGAAVGAVALTIWGKYKLLHIIGFSFLPGGIGSFAALTADPSTQQGLSGWYCAPGARIDPVVCGAAGKAAEDPRDTVWSRRHEGAGWRKRVSIQWLDGMK